MAGLRPSGLPRSGLVQRLGFNPNASAERSMITVKIGRIRDKTRWTKALGEAEDRCLWGL
jgi:hypothetical protein